MRVCWTCGVFVGLQAWRGSRWIWRREGGGDGGRDAIGGVAEHLQGEVRAAVAPAPPTCCTSHRLLRLDLDPFPSQNGGGQAKPTARRVPP